MPATSSVGTTGSAMIDGVLSGTKWAVNNFTFSFPTDGTFYGSAYGSGENLNGFEAFNATQQAAVRNVLAQYAAVANITFREIAETGTQHADLRFGETGAASTAWSYYPSTRAEGGDAWFNKTDYNTPAKGNYAYATFLHEIGHSFGLKHPHEVSGAFPAMPVGYDSMESTVMSYRSYVGASTTTGYTNETWGYAQSLMMADLAGLQKMYGANYNTNSGNTTYSWSPTSGEMFVNGAGQGAPGGNKIFLTVWDGGGSDTYDFSSYSSNLNVDLQPGAWTATSNAQLARLHYDGSKIAAGNIANALLYNGDVRSLIENATGGGGNDTLSGNQANNVLRGGAGNDWFIGFAGNDTLDGGLGSDLAVYEGFFRQQTTSGNLASRTIASSAEGADALLNVEVVEFGDGRWVFDTADAAAVAYRMYDSAFDRAPDALGLNHWIGNLQNGLSASDMASGFANSAEFQATYGSLNNRQFVEQLYRNVLDREGESAGVNSWTSLLETGAQTRGQVLAGFSESAEHIEKLRPAVETGIWDINETAASVARLYHAALDRAPEAGGLRDWTNAVEGGLSLADAADGFAFSAEFQGKYGALTNEGFVEQLYSNVLNRQSDPGGLAHWTNLLNSNTLDRGDVLLGFSESAEHQTLTLPVIENGILLA